MATRKTTKRRAALYARVSTKNGHQDPSNQLRELRKAAKRMGWTVAATYVDDGISGTKGREHRPQFRQLCRGVARREFDVVMAWSVDRIGRSLQDLIGFLGELHAKGVDLYLDRQGVDTTTPSGRALFQMMGVFAEFERSMIVERVNAGLARARAQGKRLGRPTVASKAVANKVKRLAAKNRSLRQIAEEAGISKSSVHKILTGA